MSEFIHDDCCERCPNTKECYAKGECLLEPPVAPSRSAAPPFSKGYTHRHGEPVSDACGDGKHSECTQDYTKCHCTVRGGHTTMHAYMNFPASAAPPSEREAATSEFDEWWDGVYGHMSAWVNSKEIAKAAWAARAAVPQAAAQRTPSNESLRKIADQLTEQLQPLYCSMSPVPLEQIRGIITCALLDLANDEYGQAWEFFNKTRAAAVPAPGEEARAAELTWPQLHKVVTASAEAYGYLKADESPVAKKLGEALERVVNVLLLATKNDARIEAAYQRTYEHAQEQHKTVPIQVWADVDEGIVEIVRHLNTIPGVRTDASCQGTDKYAHYVMASWPAEVEPTLAGMYDLEFLGEHWGYVRARAGATAPPKEAE